MRARAVAPDGSWLATGGTDRTLRIWDVPTAQARALMRLDNDVHAAAWLGTSKLAVGGPAGLYLFDLLTGASLPPKQLQTPVNCPQQTESHPVRASRRQPRLRHASRQQG